MPSRWEQLLEQKPVPLLEALLEQVAKLLSRELARWPLSISELDDSTSGSMETFLQADSVRPGAAVFSEALRLAVWELQREPDALDDYMRNRRYLEQGVAPPERGALLFVTRWLVEQMLALSEATEGRVRRPDLVRCLEQVRLPGP
jgi:hypothetical protein